MRAGSLFPDPNQPEGQVQVPTAGSIPPRPSIRPLCTSTVCPRKAMNKSLQTAELCDSCPGAHPDACITRLPWDLGSPWAGVAGKADFGLYPESG